MGFKSTDILLSIDAEWSENFGTICLQIHDYRRKKSVLFLSEKVKAFSVFDDIVKYCEHCFIDVIYVNFNSNINVIDDIFLPKYHPDVKKTVVHILCYSSTKDL